MRRIKLILNIMLFSAFISIMFLGCEKASDKQSGPVTTFTSFRDIPGVTDDEIKAIEALQKQNVSFVYGMTPSTESFSTNGTIGGFSALFCEWLTGLFEIRFKPTAYEWGDLISGLKTGAVDFSGDLSPSEERQKIYFMTETIALRTLKYIRIEGSPPLSEIVATRTLRLIFFDGSTTYNHVVSSKAYDTFKALFAKNKKAAYDLLKNGKADALIAENSVEANFDVYGDVVAENFFPLIFSPVSMTTQNPKLKPIISIVNKALKNGGFLYLNELYKFGYEEYRKHKLFMLLNDKEKAYIQNPPVVPIIASNWLYPICFYNKYEMQWEGIAFDILDEVTKITGLKFELVNSANSSWAELYEMMQEGKISICLDLICTPERKDRYLWSKYPYLSENYALLSKLNFPNISTSEIHYTKTGLIKSTGYADMFQTWFPDATSVTMYETQDDAFLALDKGEVDLVMAGTNVLLSVTNYYELSNYKANFIFENVIDFSLAFNINQSVLYSIIEKSLLFIDIKTISKRWESKTFDYQSKLMRAQRPWLIGAIILSLIILALISAFFVRSRNTGKHLEKLVKQRTGELQLSTSELQERTSELEFQTYTLQTMVDSIPDIIYCKDLNLNYTLCNKFFADYLGCSKDDVVGKGNNPGSVLPADVVDLANNVDRKVVNEGRMIIFEQFLPSLHREERLFETIKAPLIIDGAVTGLVGIARDITERKAMEDKAQTASRAKSAFLANMSHEMRTPMNVVVGLTDLMLEDDNPTINFKDHLKKISTAGNTLLGLINDVLDISKIEAGRLELTPIEYEIPSLLNDIIILNIIRIESKPLAFRLEINEKLPCTLYGDDLRIKQIINNLLSNAFKYTQKGTVTLGMNCEREGDDDVRMSVWVSDTGIGIREEDLKKLFTNYSQVDSLANRQIEGTGLGLSITKMLVEHMNGEISVESEYGKGTTFRFHIRQKFVSDRTIGAETTENLRSFRYAEDKRKAAQKLVRPDLSYASVLVVDDMPNNLDVAAALLGKYKMRVDCVAGGQEAIDRINKCEPFYDAIFMDHMMPGMDGVEAATKIRAIGTKYAMTIPIIALTANAIAGNEQMFLNNDFQAFLAKPINIMNLDAIVQRWIRDKSRE